MKNITREDLEKYTLGTWLFCGDKDRNPNNDDDADKEAIRMHIDKGVRQIFTAQNYAEGWVEKITGEVVKDYEREKLVLMTAIKKQDSAYDDMMRSIEESLERMQLDYIDIVVHHAPLPEVPRKESIKALNKIVDKGLARGLAVSNYNSKSMKEAIANSNHTILFNQVYYNLFVRQVEDDNLLDICKKNAVYIQAYRPLELGELATVKSDLMDELTEKYSLTEAQIALSWLTSRENIIVTCNTHSEEHLKENLKGINTQLSDEDIQRLTENFPVRDLDKIFIR
jgi:diketogulonate reductase-like aldo/keto reductase